MAERGAQTGSGEETPSVPWPNVVRFVRQLSHDLRNHLNAAELQSVFVNELAQDAEIKAEIQRLREMLATTGAALQKLSALFAPPRPNLIAYAAADFMTDIQQKFETDFADRKERVQWRVETGEAILDVDPQLMQEAIFELLENAFRHGKKDGRVEVAARVEGEQFLLEVREPKAEIPAEGVPEWSREAMQGAGGTGHYGLGLQRVRAIATANRGRLETRLNSTPPALVSTIMLPLSRGER